MSKIGSQPVIIKEGVEVKTEGRKAFIKGSKGEITISIPSRIDVKVSDNKVVVERRSESKKVRSCHGTIRNLIKNATIGVTEGWSKSLAIVGTGYRAAREGNSLVLNVGFINPVRFEIPEGLEFEIEEAKIVIKGIDKQFVGQVAAKIRKIRKPDAYLGKGIRYENEEIKLKPGKAANKE
jgi:large subunit ribosomal protein L6